ncbi:MAG: GGDEF domain-containing protein, partial [Pseudomonadota bacterium]
LRRQTERLEQEVASRTAALSERTADLERLADEKTDLAVRLERQSAAFERQAREDSLTGLPNRRHFDEELGRAFLAAREAGTPIAVGLFDLDHFKRINDRFSHQIGDRVLERIGAVLRGLSEEDVTAARYGGEEFALLFRGLPPDRVFARAEALREEIAGAGWETIASELSVTASIGLSADSGVDHHERMLVAADHELYRAKHEGRNRVSWNREERESSDSATH